MIPSRARSVRILYSSRIRLRVTASLSPLFCVRVFYLISTNDGQAAGKKKSQRFLKNPWLKGDYREG